MSMTDSIRLKAENEMLREEMRQMHMRMSFELSQLSDELKALADEHMTRWAEMTNAG